MKIDKKELKAHMNSLFDIISEHIKRHNTLLIVLLSFILALNITFSLVWHFSLDNVPAINEILFYVAQGIMFVTTCFGIIGLLLFKKNEIKNNILAIANHIYALFIMMWATLVFCLDLSLGFSPLTYLLALMFVAGIFVIDPIYFTFIEILSIIPVSITIATDEDIFFGGKFLAENIVIFAAFLVLISAISFRNYRVNFGSFKVQKKLHELSYKDELTGLLNERSYIETVDEINARLKSGEDVKFAVVLMDVNNLKATNDAYGHRF